MKPYHELALIPELIAETVLNEKYTGQELSAKTRCFSDVEKIERRRICMSDKRREDFIRDCDARCRSAYENKSKWFMDCVKSKSNRGRDILYNWTRHWLAGFLSNDQ